jgi:hypothetical protein
MVRAKKKASNDSSYRTMKADYYPVQRVMNLGTSANSTRIIADVGRLLSATNHRLYRQGKTYQVKIDMDNRPDEAAGSSQYDVYALVDTWYVQKAWQLARATYLKATADERALMSDQQKARWEDFRVNSGVGTGAVFAFPYNYSETLVGAVNSNGEFDPSEITLADGSTERTFTWGSTPTASEFSILQEYDKTGDTDARPSTSSAAKGYSGTDVGVHESQSDDLASRGNLPPYNATNFSDNVWVKIATLDNSGPTNPGASGGHSRMSTGFFNVPCGLVVLVPTISSSLNGNVTMTVKSGQYKGVAAMNMGA